MAGQGARHRGRMKARRVAVQALYQWQLGGQAPTDILAEFIAQRELDEVDMEYFAELTRHIPRDVAALEEVLTPCLGRPFAQLDPVERAVLLIGAYELRSSLEVPARVIINEAVELTKTFGAEQAHRFVNGALDRLAHDLRGPEFAERQHGGA